MRATGRTAVLNGPQSVAVLTQAVTEPGPHQIRVRLEGCGVCGSNLPIWEGRPWFDYPRPAGSPGHEGWGRIDALGAEVDDFRAGDRVAVLSYHAFADYDLADADQAVRLPPELAGQPFPGEALGCAMNVLRRSDIRAGQTAAVVGVGFLGALLVNLAARAGARVIALARRGYARDIARRLGAAEVVPLANAAEAIGAVKELTGGAGCERVIEATGWQMPLDVASEITREGGRLIIAGYHQDGMRQVNMQLWNWRGLDVINAHERDPRQAIAGMQAAVDAVVSGRLDPTPLYTDRFRLEELAQAFAGMSGRPPGFMKALLAYD
jgi:threonine dehydrogenase-like Zn-dependent dehydrogenase